MNYEIVGEPLPTLICNLEAGEQIVCERGAMSWMSPNMVMDTSTNGGFGKMMGRMFSGESLMQNIYKAEGGSGLLAMSSSFPGSILAFDIAPGNEMIVQKTGYLASEPSVELSVFFQKRFGAGFFGGEGFIMQKLSGQGKAFVEIDGNVIKYDLAPGEKMIIDTGYLAAMSSTCTMEITQVKGIKNKLLGGEGFFNTVVTGPGQIYLQSMPKNQIASALSSYISTGN